MVLEVLYREVGSLDTEGMGMVSSRGRGVGGGGGGGYRGGSRGEGLGGQDSPRPFEGPPNFK